MTSIMMKLLARRLAMPRNSLLSLLFVTLLCLCACSDNSSSAKSDVNTQKFKVAVMATTSEMPRWKRCAKWALENIDKAQAGLDQKVKLQLEFKNQDDADIDSYMEKIAHDTDYVAIVGPTQSTRTMWPLLALRNQTRRTIWQSFCIKAQNRFYHRSPRMWNTSEPSPTCRTCGTWSKMILC